MNCKPAETIKSHDNRRKREPQKRGDKNTDCERELEGDREPKIGKDMESREEESESRKRG